MADEKIPWSPGRRAGSINKRTQAFQAKLEERGFDVAEAFLDIRDEAAKQYNKCDSHDPIAAIAALKLLRDVTADIASYSLPKLKSIEVVATNPLEGMTAQEKLQTMRDAVAVLETEVANQEAVQIESNDKS